MMEQRLWRICAKRHGKGAFSGDGAKLFGGRWNPEGVPLVYTSTTLSLAALELFVNLDPEDLPGGFVSIEVRAPQNLSSETIEMASLPHGWRRCPAPAPLQEIGRRWVERGESLLLSVPSVVIPQECNVLINPRHPEFSLLSIEAAKRFSLDTGRGRES
jgi:RES domain-containing protein